MALSKIYIKDTMERKKCARCTDGRILMIENAAAGGSEIVYKGFQRIVNNHADSQNDD